MIVIVATTATVVDNNTLAGVNAGKRWFPSQRAYKRILFKNLVYIIVMHLR